MLDQQQQDAEHEAGEHVRGEALYRRPMPGGGFVEVEIAAAEGVLTEPGSRQHHGRVVMERRADPERRAGHRAPVVAELAADDRDELMGELFRLAQDNAALARSLMRWQARRQRAD
jgi:hypothetical protein